jgi:hypothetical protein
MDRIGDALKNIQPIAELVPYNPALHTHYNSQDDPLYTRARESQADALPLFLEEGFSRVGPARYITAEETASSDSDTPLVVTPTKRMNSDGRRPHRAQPTRRVYNAR